MSDLNDLTQAAGAGNAEAQFLLGYRLATGQGVDKDTGRALQYLLMATKQDHADAMYHLAMMLENGIGLDAPHYPLAARMYVRGVAKHSDRRAARCLGVMHATGRGVERDPALAKELFEYAISAGEDSAMYPLGLLLADNAQVRDVAAAVMWAVLSVQHQPQGPGGRLLQALTDKAAPDLVAEGRALAANWVRTPKGLTLVSTGDTANEFASLSFT